jgi:hypothetical protein
VSLDDPRRRANRTQGGSAPDPEHAFDLDADEPPRLAEPIMQSSPFVVVDRGPAQILKIATPRAVT